MNNFLEQLLKEFSRGLSFVIGILVAMYLIVAAFNYVEYEMLEQNCDAYLDTLYEQNLVPHRCYLEEDNN